jgi:hypothetical protein
MSAFRLSSHWKNLSLQWIEIAGKSIKSLYKTSKGYVFVLVQTPLTTAASKSRMTTWKKTSRKFLDAIKCNTGVWHLSNGLWPPGSLCASKRNLRRPETFSNVISQADLDILGSQWATKLIIICEMCDITVHNHCLSPPIPKVPPKSLFFNNNIHCMRCQKDLSPISNYTNWKWNLWSSNLSRIQ